MSSIQDLIHLLYALGSARFHRFLAYTQNGIRQIPSDKWIWSLFTKSIFRLLYLTCVRTCEKCSQASPAKLLKSGSGWHIYEVVWSSLLFISLVVAALYRVVVQVSFWIGRNPPIFFNRKVYRQNLALVNWTVTLLLLLQSMPEPPI